MGVALLDTSAVIGYLDADDRLHPDAVEHIEATMRSGTSIALSAISWTELLAGASLGYRDSTTVRDFAGDFAVEVLPVDRAVAERAADLQAAQAVRPRGVKRSRLRTPDALILATADTVPAVELVICGDEQWSKVRGLRPRIQLIAERGA